MQSRDDQFLVSQPLEIQSILATVLRKRTLVRLDVPGRDTSVISTILQIDPSSGDLLLDNAAAADINTRLLAAEAVRFQASLDRILIEFHGVLSASEWEGRPAFRMARPGALHRLQRREFFRIEVPPRNPATFTLRDASFKDATTPFPLYDISAGGLRLIDNDRVLAESVGMIYKGRLELPDVQAVDVDLRLLRSAEIPLENNKSMHTVACKYFNLATNKQITIQQYIGLLERAVMARRWAME